METYFFKRIHSSAVDNRNVFKLFEKGDEPTRYNQGGISGNSKTIDFTGVVCDLDLDAETKLESKSSTKTSTKLESMPSTKASTKLGSKTSAKTDSNSLANKSTGTVATSSVF